MDTHNTGRHEGRGVGIHVEPPEMSLQEGQGVADSWVTGKLGSVSPLENLGTDRLKHKEMIRETVSWVRFIGPP